MTGGHSYALYIVSRWLEPMTNLWLIVILLWQIGAKDAVPMEFVCFLLCVLFLYRV